jgi:DNA-binding transcriptional MerR regulator/methylmalonyl-CoA mutase cobalamin-binding subunit
MYRYRRDRYDLAMEEYGRLRIGELSRRVGVSPELLRAWETRYALVQPERTPGGLRLYSAEDERRVREMQQQIGAGLSAAEAARIALRATAEPVPVERLLSRLDDSLTALDEPAAQATLDQTFESLDLEPALGQVILPFLHGLGRRWAAAERSIAQEHFASNVIGGRLRSLSRGWGAGDGPRVVLACPPGEQHELGLLCFGLLLRYHGWTIAYLGAETPPSDLGATIAELSPELVVLGSTEAQRFVEVAEGIRALGVRTRIAIGGAGASPALAQSLGTELLTDDVVSAARAVSAAAS